MFKYIIRYNKKRNVKKKRKNLLKDIKKNGTGFKDKTLKREKSCYNRSGY